MRDWAKAKVQALPSAPQCLLISLHTVDAYLLLKEEH